MSEDWKRHWEEYLAGRRKDDIKDEIEPIEINLGEIDFYIPPLLGANVESMKAIAKHNAKQRIFG